MKRGSSISIGYIKEDFESIKTENGNSEMKRSLSKKQIPFFISKLKRYTYSLTIVKNFVGKNKDK